MLDDIINVLHGADGGGLSYYEARDQFRDAVEERFLHLSGQKLLSALDQAAIDRVAEMIFFAD